MTNVVQDDDVEEYDFSNEPDEDDDEEDDGLDTAHYKYPNGVMPISSDDEDDNNRPEENWQPTIPSWRVHNFSVLARSELENMYCELPDYAMKDSTQMLDWDVTEEYIRERDNEMLRYVYVECLFCSDANASTATSTTIHCHNG